MAAVGDDDIAHRLVVEFAPGRSRRADGGDELIESLQSAGFAKPHFAPCDVRDVTAYQALLAEVAKQLGPIRVLVNNAGRDDRHAMEEVTPEFWDDRLALNLKHYFFAIQAVAPGMAEAGGGSVINMGSVSWMRGRPNLVGYTTAKAGILGFTRALAHELAPHEIRVNAIAPGYMATNNTAALRADEGRNASILERIPAGRCWSPPSRPRVRSACARSGVTACTTSTCPTTCAAWCVASSIGCAPRSPSS